MAEMPLPDLMSFEPCETLATQIERFNAAVRERGSRPEGATPIVVMTGIAFAVIPEVRIFE